MASAIFGAVRPLAEVTTQRGVRAVFVCFFVCWDKTRNSILPSLCLEGFVDLSMEFHGTLKIIARILREVVNRERLCGTITFYFGRFSKVGGCQAL